jgi:RNA polymerase sigma-70 factor, ECF subfamily
VGAPGRPEPRRRPGPPEPATPGCAAAARPPAPAPAAQVEDLALLEALRGLSVGQRQVLVLHYLIGMTVEEVATTLGVPTGTVKVRLARGRHALAARLGEQQEVRPQHE